jgi:DNA primase large subunit
MPYSLHEKTALASVVLTKEELDKFNPAKDAEPINAKIRAFMPNNTASEGEGLLRAALEWKSKQEEINKPVKKLDKKYEELNMKGVSEELFPKPIKKLLKGLKDGRKRGLFVLLGFFRTLGFSSDYINDKIREWNKLNDPPLKEGYIKSQIEWHLRQKKPIMPPNYSNDGFYKDIGILEEEPRAKNPIVEVLRGLRK